MKIAVVGAGPAGILAAAVLTRAGYKIALFASAQPRSPRGEHVHTVPQRSWERLVALAGAQAGLPEAWPGRAAFDAMLHAFGERLDGVQHCGRYESAALAEAGAGPGWSVKGRSTHVEADWLLDCSGAARVTARAVSQALGEPLCCDEADHHVSYASWRASADPGMLPAPLRFWSPCHEAGLLADQDASGGLTITLQDFSGGQLDCDRERLQALVGEAGAEWASLLPGQEAALEGPRIWPPVPVALVDMVQVAGAGIPWLAAGDALLTTPPVLGWGLTCLAEQLSIIDADARSGELDRAQERAGQLGRHRFSQAMLAGQMRSVPEFVHA